MSMGIREKTPNEKLAEKLNSLNYEYIVRAHTGACERAESNSLFEDDMVFGWLLSGRSFKLDGYQYKVDYGFVERSGPKVKQPEPDTRTKELFTVEVL